jgi:hypothetical protein
MTENLHYSIFDHCDYHMRVFLKNIHIYKPMYKLLQQAN